MSVIGLSLLVASFTFFCYRIPPSSWLITQWLRRPASILDTKSPLDAPTIELSEPSTEKEKTTDNVISEKESKKEPSIWSRPTTKQELDRITMPPPPPPFIRPSRPSPPSSPPTPRASAPSFSIPTPEVEEPSVPSFPALNSAQRASGGTRGPPRLNPAPMPQSSQGGLMPPPRAPGLLPSRGPPSLSSLAPPPTHTAIPTKPRRKVLLTPGHSPLDWARLTSSPSANLTGLPVGTPFLRVPPSLLKQMTGRKGKDAWTVLGGKVYNISPYAPYHPGGEPELLKAAGRDGSKLFGEVHPWINWEGMLEGCLVGIAVGEDEVKPAAAWEEMD